MGYGQGQGQGQGQGHTADRGGQPCPMRMLIQNPAPLTLVFTRTRRSFEVM